MDDDEDRLEDPANVVSPYPSYYEGPRMDFNPLTSNSPSSSDLKNSFRGRHDINCTLWVGNLDQRVSEAIIQELFLQIGPIQSVIFPKRKEDCGRNRGFCFVNFFHPNSVPRAIQTMGQTVLFGRKLNLRSRPHSVHSTNQNLMPGADRFVEVVDHPFGNPASSGPHKRPLGYQKPAGSFHGVDDHESQYSRTVCIARPDNPDESPERKVLVVHSSLCSEPDVKIKIWNYSKPKISSVLVTPPPSTATRPEMNTKESDTSEDKGQAECSKFDSKRSPKRSDNLTKYSTMKPSEHSGQSDPSFQPAKTHRNVSFPSSNESLPNEPTPAVRMNDNNEHVRFNEPYGNNWQDYWQSGETGGPVVSNQWPFGHQVWQQPARPHGRYIWVNANFHQQQHHQHQNYQRVHPYYSQQRFYNNEEPFHQSYDNQKEMYSRTNNGQFSWVNNNNPSYWKGSNDPAHGGPSHQREYCNQNPSHNFESYQAHQSEHRELINLSPSKQATSQIPESTTTTSSTLSSRPQNDQIEPTNNLTDPKNPPQSHKPSRHRSSSSDSDASRKYSRSRRRRHHRRYSSSSSSSYSSSSSSNDDKQVSSSSHVRSSKSSNGKKNNSSSKLSSSPGQASEYDPHHPQL